MQPAPVALLLVVFSIALGCKTRELAPGSDRARRHPPAGVQPSPKHDASPPERARAANSTADPDLDAEAGSATRPAQDSQPRLYALSRFVWIWPEPDASRQWIGFLWFGGSVALKSSKPVAGPGCQRFYAIEPRGYVCVDERKATLDAESPLLTAIRPYAPRVDTPCPHRYGESRGLRRYTELPREPQAKIQQPKDGGSVQPLLAEDTSTEEPPVTLPALPRGLREDRSELGPRSTVAYAAETQHRGRSWLLSADLMWVPKDRVRVYPGVDFHGVELGKNARLPLAFFRGKDRPRYSRNSDDSLTANGRVFSRLSWVQLTGSSVDHDGEKYLETADGSYVKAKDAVIPQLRETTPWGAKVGATDDTGRGPRGRQTWMDVSVWGGWLIAYEGTRAVFTTLVSPGRGGTPEEGKEPLETGATPTGRFNITGKFKTATMVAPGELIHSDVPWAQNFTGPYALHGAYWHNDWGQLKSSGCVNVSPIDGKWLFEWTEPDAPPGWHGVRWLPRLEAATTFIVHR